MPEHEVVALNANLAAGLTSIEPFLYYSVEQFTKQYGLTDEQERYGITGGEREYVFQTADPFGFKQRFIDMEQEPERYPIEIYLNDDPDWNYYKSVCDSVEQ